MGYGIPGQSLDPGDGRFAHAFDAHGGDFIEGLPRLLETVIGRSGCRTEVPATGLAEKPAASALFCTIEGMAADIPFPIFPVEWAVWIRAAPVNDGGPLHETCPQVLGDYE